VTGPDARLLAARRRAAEEGTPEAQAVAALGGSWTHAWTRVVMGEDISVYASDREEARPFRVTVEHEPGMVMEIDWSDPVQAGDMVAVRADGTVGPAGSGTTMPIGVAMEASEQGEPVRVIVHPTPRRDRDAS